MATITANNLRRPLIVGCLAAALLMVAALGYEAVTAARAQRETAEGVLRDYAGLDKNLVVIGVSERLEIWDAAEWRTYAAAADEYYSTIEEALSDSGI